MTRKTMIRYDQVKFETLIGKTIENIEVGTNSYMNYPMIEFFTNDGSHYVLHHEQDCCETVEIKQIDGDLYDLIGVPILMAEVVIGEVKSDEGYDVIQYCFYKLATYEGYVTIQFVGESNGYYSTEVQFSKISKDIGVDI